MPSHRTDDRTAEQGRFSPRYWVAWSTGLAIFSYGTSVALLGGSKVWLVLLLALALAFAALSFPCDQKLHLRMTALGFYVPLVMMFFIRSYDRIDHSAVVWSLLGVGSLVLVSTSMVGVLRIGAARRALPWLIGAGICGLMIGYFSGGRGGADPWMHFLMRTYGWDRDLATEVVHYIRKTIHFGFYGTLAWFAAKGAYAAGATPRWAALFALLWAIPHACFDEVRQAFSPGRTASILDVILDVTGMVVFLAGFWTRPARLEEPSPGLAADRG